MDAAHVTAIIIALIAAVPPSLIGLAALRKSAQANNKIQTVHFQINSRMDQLLAATASASRAEGAMASRARLSDDEEDEPEVLEAGLEESDDER